MDEILQKRLFRITLSDLILLGCGIGISVIYPLYSGLAQDRYIGPNFQIILSLTGIMLVWLFSRVAENRPAVGMLCILLSGRYLLWRALYTLNTASWIGSAVSLILLSAEIYSVIHVGLFFVQAAAPTDRAAPQIAEPLLPGVDVFIPIYNEPPDILYRTIVGCQALDYPAEKKNIYVLDDGRREEIKNMAAHLGCQYISRGDNKYGKAGNLNNALKYSGGEIIVFFDCDHVPVRSFIRETIGFFTDPGVGFVQTPQHFYNPEFFQRNLKFLQEEICHEQDLFFHVVQPGKDFYNSAFFCGTGGLIRRSALEKIGGFTQYAVIEDLPTSIELHNAGYKSVYLNKDLAAGIAPESFAGYINQRKRWTKAGIQIFLLNNPLLKQGLNFYQKLNYLSSTYYFFHSFARIVVISWSLPHLLLGVTPIVSPIISIIHYFLAYHISVIVAIGMYSKRYRNPFFTDVYETISAFSTAAAAISIFMRPRNQVTTVTPKGEQFKNAALAPSVVPHIVLLVLLGLGITAGLLKAALTGYDGYLLISLFWGLYSAMTVTLAIFSARELPQRRNCIRVYKRIACQVNQAGKSISGFTREISETGCSIMLDNPELLPEAELDLELKSNYGEITKLKGRIVRYDRYSERETLLGIKFVDINEPARQGIIRQMFSPPDSWLKQHNEIRERDTSEDLLFFVTTPLKMFVQEKILRRFAPRFPVTWPCEINLGLESVRGVTRDISSSGLSIEFGQKVELPEEIEIKLMKKNRPVELRGRLVWEKHGPKGTIVGVEILKPFRGNQLWKESDC